MNKTEQPISIKSFQTGCSCTTVPKDPIVVPPHGQARIPVTIATADNEQLRLEPYLPHNIEQSVLLVFDDDIRFIQEPDVAEEKIRDLSFALAYVYGVRDKREGVG